jgi:hypothetical protein
MCICCLILTFFVLVVYLFMICFWLSLIFGIILKSLSIQLNLQEVSQKDLGEAQALQVCAIRESWCTFIQAQWWPALLILAPMVGYPWHQGTRIQ